MLLLITASANAAEPWHALGRPLGAAEIAPWDIDVRPDGKGLPVGRGSAAEGQALYDAQCASCHGTFGESNDYLALAGGIGSLASENPQRTVGSKLDYATTLWDYINRAMPFTQSKSLSADEVYALTAYVLNLNDVVAYDTVLDQASLPAVQMPNRAGYTTAHGMMQVDGTPDVSNTVCMQDCLKAPPTISSQLPEGFADEMYGDLRVHFRALAGLTDGTPAPAPAVAEDAQGPLARAGDAGCLVCHGVDKGVVGPAFTAVAARYSGLADARATLTAKVRNGGSGTWGSAMMPPQRNVADAELALILDWVLAGAKP